jgi:hypothetical protein
VTVAQLAAFRFVADCRLKPSVFVGQNTTAFVPPVRNATDGIG